MFCVFGGYVLGESGEKAITILGDHAQQTRPVTSARGNIRRTSSWIVKKRDNIYYPKYGDGIFLAIEYALH